MLEMQNTLQEEYQKKKEEVEKFRVKYQIRFHVLNLCYFRKHSEELGELWSNFWSNYLGRKQFYRQNNLPVEINNFIEDFFWEIVVDDYRSKVDPYKNLSEDQKMALMIIFVREFAWRRAFMYPHTGQMTLGLLNPWSSTLSSYAFIVDNQVPQNTCFRKRLWIEGFCRKNPLFYEYISSAKRDILERTSNFILKEKDEIIKNYEELSKKHEYLSYLIKKEQEDLPKRPKKLKIIRDKYLNKIKKTFQKAFHSRKEQKTELLAQVKVNTLENYPTK